MDFQADVEALLVQGERLLWVGKPSFWPYFLPSFAYIPIGLFILFFVVPLSIILFGSPLSSAGAFSLIRYTIFLFYMPLYFAMLAAILAPVFSLISHHYENYAITNGRVFIRKGTLNIDTAAVTFEQIRRLDVVKGLSDRVLAKGTATLVLETPDLEKKIRRLQNLEKPYEAKDLLSSHL